MTLWFFFYDLIMSSSHIFGKCNTVSICTIITKIWQPHRYLCDKPRAATFMMRVHNNIVFPLLTDFVCLYTYEFWLSLCKIVRSSVILLLLPLYSECFSLWKDGDLLKRPGDPIYFPFNWFDQRHLQQRMTPHLPTGSKIWYIWRPRLADN
jgi:hypothetical protein